MRTLRHKRTNASTTQSNAPELRLLPDDLRCWLPMLFLQAVLWFTVVLLAFGPWPYPIEKPWKFYGYLTLVHVSLFAGYTVGIWRYRRLAYNFNPTAGTLHTMLIVAALWLVPTAVIRLGDTAMSPDAFISAVVRGLTHPGEQYNQFHTESIDSGIPKILLYLNILILPVAFAAVPFCIFWWRRLGVFWKALLGMVIVFDATTWIARGTNNGLFQVVVTTLWATLAAYVAQGYRIHLRMLVRIGLILAIALSLLLAFFTQGHTERVSESKLTVDAALGVYVDPERPLMELTPEPLQPTLISFTRYACQGYYALALALEEPFIPCWGIGNSYFLQGWLRRILPTDRISDQSYPGRLELKYGIDRNTRWHTFYVWFASDIGFSGVVILVGVIGWLLATVWLDALYTRHLYAVALLCLLIVMVMFFPGNNQVLGFGSFAIPFMACLPLWMLWRSGIPTLDGRSRSHSSKNPEE